MELYYYDYDEASLHLCLIIVLFWWGGGGARIGETAGMPERIKGAEKKGIIMTMMMEIKRLIKNVFYF